jgi:cytoskeleton protein RodZ
MERCVAKEFLSRIQMMDTPDPDSMRHGTEPGPGKARESVGQLLRTARVNRGLSVEDVARQLRLSVRQITALEEDNYDKLVSNTFLRGFVRNYAKLLQIDASPLLQQLEQLLPPAPAQTITYQIEGIPFPSNRKQGARSFLIVGGAILALVLLIYEIYRGNEITIDSQQPASKAEPQTGGRPEAETSSSSSPSAIHPANDGKVESLPEEQNAIEQKSEVSPPGSDQAPISAPVPVPAGVPAPVQQTVPAAVGPQNEGVGPVPGGNTQRHAAGSEFEAASEWKDTVRLVFGGESWTEVKDGRGRLLLSRINPPGTEQLLRGKPPFSLAIGNAVAVQLVYNGKPVDLSPYINRYGGTARLSLE